MTTRYGMFGEATGIGIGDPYIDVAPRDPRERGLNMRAPVCKTGKNNDACFDEFKPLFAGEKFVEPLRRARPRRAKLQAAGASRARNVSERPFRAASPMKASACPGDFVGTLGGKVAYMPGVVDVRRKKGEVPQQLKNVVTSAPKKGGFGFVGTTLSERQGARGVAGEYEYLADPLQAPARPAAGGGGRVPFQSAGPPKKGGPGTVTRHFGGRAKGALGEFEWRPCPAPPVAGPASASGGGTAGGADDGPPAAGAVAGARGGGSGSSGSPAAAFRPAAAPKMGRYATLAPFPPYEHDPEEPRAAGRAKAAACSGGAWRPGGGTKSDATRSVLRMNL